MKAAILENKGVMTYGDVEQPVLQSGHVLLQVNAASICGSDLSRYVKGHRLYPLILGHEVAGVIIETGAGVDAQLVGRHAAVIPLVPCFECNECQRGFFSACHRYSFIGSRQSGGFAEYVQIPVRNVLLLPDSISFEKATLIEPATVARHILDLGNFEAGQSAVVLGGGSIGLMTVQWLRILGAKLIVCTDVLDENLATARDLGAHKTFNPKRVNVKDEVRKLIGDGVDLTIEASGSPQALAESIQITRPRGTVVCAGNQPLDANLPMAFIEDLMRRELAIKGCFMSYSAPFPGHEWVESLQAVIDRRLDMDAMITHRFVLSETPHVFEQIAARQFAYRKIILQPQT